MQPSLAPQNRDDAAAEKPINYQPTRVFYPFHDESSEQIRALVEHTKRELDCLNED